MVILKVDMKAGWLDEALVESKADCSVDWLVGKSD